MSSSTLQASLFLRPPLSTSYFKPRSSLFSSSSSFHPQSLSSFYRLSSVLHNSRFRPFPCSLRQDNVASDSDYLPKDPAFVSEGEITDSAESNRLVTDTEVSKFETNDRLVGGEGTSEAGEVKIGGEEGEIITGVTEGKEEEQKKSKFRIVVLMMGLWAAIKRAMEKVMEWEWLSWWPFSRQEKRLEKLIAEADANPKDAALQGALLAELNKHMYVTLSSSD